MNRRELFKIATAAAVIGGTGGWQKELAARGLPIKIGITDWNLRKEGQPEAVEYARRLGFDGVEVSLGIGTERLPLADPAVQARYLDESRKHSLPIASTCLNILHRNYLKNDPLGKRWVAESIPITKALGARVILLPFFGRGALRTAAEKDFVGDFMKEIAPEAEKAGVILGLENTISAEDNARILDRAKSKAVLVYYDIGNSTGGGFDVAKEIRWLGKDRIGQIHIKDNPHLLGQGKIDMRRVADAIAESGYTGWAQLETDSPRKNLDMDLSFNLGYVRGLFEQANS